MNARGNRKYCRRCDTWKTVADFGKNRCKGDGLAVTCRACRSAIRSKKRRHRVRTDVIRQKEQVWRDKNRDHLRDRVNAHNTTLTTLFSLLGGKRQRGQCSREIGRAIRKELVNGNG